MNYIFALQILSVNYDYVDDNFLQTLHTCPSLKRIVLHVHDNVQYHPGTTEEAWIELTEYWLVISFFMVVIYMFCKKLHNLLLLFSVQMWKFV